MKNSSMLLCAVAAVLSMHQTAMGTEPAEQSQQEEVQAAEQQEQTQPIEVAKSFFNRVREACENTKMRKPLADELRNDKTFFGWLVSVTSAARATVNKVVRGENNSEVSDGQTGVMSAVMNAVLAGKVQGLKDESISGKADDIKKVLCEAEKERANIKAALVNAKINSKNYNELIKDKREQARNFVKRVEEACETFEDAVKVKFDNIKKDKARQGIANKASQLEKSGRWDVLLRNVAETVKVRYNVEQILKIAQEINDLADAAIVGSVLGLGKINEVANSRIAALKNEPDKFQEVKNYLDTVKGAHSKKLVKSGVEAIMGKKTALSLNQDDREKNHEIDRIHKVVDGTFSNIENALEVAVDEAKVAVSAKAADMPGVSSTEGKAGIR